MFAPLARPRLRRPRSLAAPSLILFCLLVAPLVTRAQENATSAPPPLQWPTLEPGPTANRFLAVSLLRGEIEKGANEVLCRKLMEAAGQPIPPNFTFDQCPARFQDEIAARQGAVKWVPGARPTECGTNCVGRPGLSQSMARDRPNTFFAQLSGHLDFEVEVPNFFNRTVRYGYGIEFHCVTSGAREGNVTVRAVFDRPFVLEGGVLEDITNFILSPFALSDRVEAGIRSRLTTPGGVTSTQGTCNSVGVNRSEDPANDSFIYNRPRPSAARGAHVVGTTILHQKSATVRLLRVTRKPVSGFSPPPETGRFHVFVNGRQGNFPPPAIELPASGGSAELNLCKTIDMKDANRLQLLFANSHGGAVWSQFVSSSNFGAGRRRRMITSRTIKVAGRPGLGGGVLTRVLREYELFYIIEFNTRPTVLVGGRGTTGGTRGTVGTLTDIVTTDTEGRQPPPCRQI